MSDWQVFEKLFKDWQNRVRLQRLVRWGLRGGCSGILLALLAVLPSLWLDRLVQSEYLAWVLFGGLTGGLAGTILGAFWPVSGTGQARRFDHQLALKERLSTALELAASRPESDPWRQRQLHETMQCMQRIDMFRALPVRLPRIETLLLAALLALSGVLAVWGRPYFLAAQQTRSVQAAIQEQTAQVEAILQQIEQDPTLTDAQRLALTTPLKEALEQLGQATTPEQAASTLNQAGDQLKNLAENDPYANSLGPVLQKAGETLQAAENAALQAVGESLAQGDLAQAAQALEQIDPSQMDAASQQTLANSLSQAPDQVQAIDPALARQMQAAVQNLNTGDLTEEDIQNAAQALQAAAQAQASAQTVRQAANQLARQMSQLQGQNLAQSSSAPGNSLSQNSATPGVGASGSPDGSTGSTGASSSNQASNGEEQGQAGGGAGKGDQQAGSEATNPAGSQPIGQDNGPGDGGERPYESIYAPQRLGGAQNNPVVLPASGEPGEVNLGQVPSQPGAPAASTVPYVDVLPAYQELARQAVSGDQVPVHLRALVREYFSALQP